MLFKDILGQETLKKEIPAWVDSGRMPHAVIMLGAEGCGKLALALAFAQYVLCGDGKEGLACGICPNCIKASKYIHPDMHFSFPSVGSKVTSSSFLAAWRAALLQNPYMNVNQWLAKIGAENKQGNITALECQEIVRKLSLKSFESEWKILLIWRPEYLGKEGNRLLKLIEEPPENTLFILVAENQELILNTILSRCQLVKVPRLRDEDISLGLQRQQNLSQEQANTIAFLADGNFNEGLSLAASSNNDNQKLFLDWMRRCFKGYGPAMLEWVGEFAKIGRENQKYFLRYALHFMREFLILKMTDGKNVRLQEAEMKSARNMAGVINFEQIEKLTNIFNDCIFSVERNANPKILFMDASLQMHSILKPVVAKS